MAFSTISCKFAINNKPNLIRMKVKRINARKYQIILFVIMLFIVNSCKEKTIREYAQEGLKYEAKGDLEKAQECFSIVENSGDSAVMFELGEAYSTPALVRGYGDRDDYKAAYWYRLAAEQGHSKAQCYLGICYEEGEGVPQDYKQAAYWFEKSALQGDSHAQASIGILYYTGNGVERDSLKAEYWWEKLALSKDDSGQSLLGICFGNGSSGLPIDKERSNYWWRIVAKNNPERADKILEAIEQDDTSKE